MKKMNDYHLDLEQHRAVYFFHGVSFEKVATYRYSIT